MKKIWMALISCLLSAAILMTSLPLTAAESTGGDPSKDSYSPIEPEDGSGSGQKQNTKEMYISDVITASGRTRAEAEAKISAAGFLAVDGNLNEGAGDYLCLGFKLTEDRDEAITGLKMMTMNGGYEEWDYREFLRENTDGIAAIVGGMEAACRKMKTLLDSGSPTAKTAYDTLNLLCVPETSKSREGMPLGTYLLSSARTYDDYETLILVVQGSTLTFINNQLAVGCSDCYDNDDPAGLNGTDGWVARPYWLDDVVAAAEEKMNAVTGSDDPETAAGELLTGYAVDIDAITDDRNFGDLLSEAAVRYLSETAAEITCDGETYTSVYRLLTEAPRLAVACFVASLPSSIPAKDFGAVVSAFVSDPEGKIPGDIPPLPEVVSPLFEEAVDQLNAMSDDPYSAEGRAAILEKYGDLDEELGFFVTLVQNFISSYREQQEAYAAMLAEKKNELSTEEAMVEFSKQVEENNSQKDENEQPDSDMLFYIGPYDALSEYRFAEKAFLTREAADGTEEKVTDLGAYFELIADAAEKDEETAKALAAAVLGGFEEADRYLAKTVGLPLFIMDACLSPSNTEEYAAQYEESGDVIREAYAELGYGENECTVWVGTNKDMLETEFLARTDATIRAAEEDRVFTDQLLKAQADKHAMDKINDAMMYCGIAMAALGVFVSVYALVTSISFGTMVGFSMLMGLGLFTLGGGGAAWGLGMAGMIAAVSGLFAVILIALLIIAVIVLLIIMLIKKKKKKDEEVERTPIPTIMMDCTLDANNQNIKYAARYDVVRDVDGAPTDLNLEKCNYWNALYYTRSGDGQSPLMTNEDGTAFVVTIDSMKGPDKSVVVSNFGYREAYNLNSRADTDTALYLHCFTEDSLSGTMKKGQGPGKYIESLTMATASRKDLARSAILRKSKDFVILDYDLSPNTDYYTYLGYSTTDDPSKAITDIRASQGTTSFSMQWGDSEAKYVCIYDKNEVSCPIKTPKSATIDGDNTHFVYQIYTSKSSSVGDPILTESLKVVSDLDDVPEGYEYARWFSGGAFDFVSEARDRDYFTTHRFLCFAPEEQYRCYDTGEEYLAGFGFFSGSCAWLGDSADNLEHSAADMGFTVFGPDLTPDAMNDDADKTYIAYATTHNPKKAITDIGVFTGEPGGEGMLSDTIARAGEFFASCIVFGSGDSGYSDGESKVRSIRTSHAYVTKIEDEAYMCEEDDWEDYRVRPRAMYVCGPRSGVKPILLDDVLYTGDFYAVPTANGQNGDLNRLSGSAVSGGLGTGWKSVHALDNYYYDEYDANGDLVSHGSNLGVMRPDAAAVDCQLYLFFKNNTPDLIRGKFISSIEIVGSDEEKGAFDSARYQAMGAGEEIINLSAPLFSDPNDRFDLADDSIVYRADDPKMKGYAESCTFLVVSYQKDSSGSVGTVRIAHQDGESELPAMMEVRDSSGKSLKLYKGKYIAPDGLKRGDKRGGEKTKYAKGYVLYTSTSGEHIGHVGIMENGETGYDSGGLDYRLLLDENEEVFAANGGYEQAVVLYCGAVSAYISDIILTDASGLQNAKTELVKYGYTQYIAADLMGGCAPERYHLGISRTSVASKAIKDIRIVNEILPVQTGADGNPELIGGRPYSLIDDRPFTRINEESLTLNVEGSATPVYIYVTTGNTTEQGRTKNLTKYPERVAITNLGLRCKLGDSKDTVTYWNGVSADSPETTLPESMTASTPVFVAGNCKKMLNGTYKYKGDGVLNGDSYQAALRFRGAKSDWAKEHGQTYLVYTNHSGFTMLQYETGYKAGYLTGSADADAALLSPGGKAVSGKVGTLVSENLSAVTIIVIAAGVITAGVVVIASRKKKKPVSEGQSDHTDAKKQ